jgi:hypothetical protein
LRKRLAANLFTSCQILKWVNAAFPSRQDIVRFLPNGGAPIEEPLDFGFVSQK